MDLTATVGDGIKRHSTPAQEHREIGSAHFAVVGLGLDNEMLLKCLIK